MERYRPQVVVTYDATGPYQHPDHVHAAQAAAAAAAGTGIPAKLYFTAMRGSDWQKVWQALRERRPGRARPRPADPEFMRQMAETEERITTTIDIRPVLARKRDALLAHASQIQDSWFSKLPPDIAEVVFGRESFIRASDSTGSARARGRPVRRAPPAGRGRGPREPVRTLPRPARGCDAAWVADAPTFEQLIAEGESVPVEGWDFSWFEGRATEERPRWGYSRLLAGRMAGAAAGLDIQTGGGEVLARIPLRLRCWWPPSPGRRTSRSRGGTCARWARRWWRRTTKPICRSAAGRSTWS